MAEWLADWLIGRVRDSKYSLTLLTSCNMSGTEGDYTEWTLENVPTRKLRYLRNARIFLYQILLICLQDNCAQVCCFVLYLHNIDGNLTSRTNFATAQTIQKPHFVSKVIGCPIPPLLWCQCDVGIIIWFTLKKNDKFFNILSHNCG